MKDIIIVGAGLAGSECAWQLAQAGFKVKLYEMRPKKTSPAHITSNFAELVCSNSFRSDNAVSSAVGLMHQELRLLKSLIISTADEFRVPAGDALAVDREKFSKGITEKVSNHNNITVIREEFTNLLDLSKDSIVVVASGPLTSDSLSNEINEIINTSEYKSKLNFFDAIAPVVYSETIDFNNAWMQSRYDKIGGPLSDGKDYINCPLSKEEYTEFYNALTTAEYMQFEEWEKDVPYFEGCLPIEEMARRGFKTLLFGPLKPVGLTNPHNPTVKPYAIVQLRQDNAEKTLYNIVGFQTKLKYGEQKRVFQLIPALKNAEFAKLGSIHKNSYINSPKLLSSTLNLKNHPNIYFAGQITGCEGYVESCSVGFMAALFIIAKLKNTTIQIPRATALGSMINHITNGFSDNYQPHNINFGLFPELETAETIDYKNKKENRKNNRELIVKNAIEEINKFIEQSLKLL